MILTRQNAVLSLWTLPRHFAVPVAISSVVLGWVISAPLSLGVLLPVAAMFCISAYSHTFNTLLDYSWTGFDKGEPEDRSRPKPYTSGQQIIADKLLSPGAVFGIGFVWLVTGVVVAAWGGMTVYLFACATACITFWYSWGKLHWQAETALAVGFGPLPALMGAAASGTPDYLAAALASLPIAIIFGFSAEIFDQWWDADANWRRGLRNIGAWVWHKNLSVSAAVAISIGFAYWAQLALWSVGILKSGTWLTVIAVVPLLVIKSAEDRQSWAVMLLLGGVFLYCGLLVFGQTL